MTRLLKIVFLVLLTALFFWPKTILATDCTDSSTATFTFAPNSGSFTSGSLNNQISLLLTVPTECNVSGVDMDISINQSSPATIAGFEINSSASDLNLNAGSVASGKSIHLTGTRPTGAGYTVHGQITLGDLLVNAGTTSGAFTVNLNNVMVTASNATSSTGIVLSVVQASRTSGIYTITTTPTLPTPTVAPKSRTPSCINTPTNDTDEETIRWTENASIVNQVDVKAASSSTIYSKSITTGSAGSITETSIPDGFTGLTLSPTRTYNVRLVSGSINGNWYSFTTPAACVAPTAAPSATPAPPTVNFKTRQCINTPTNDIDEATISWTDNASIADKVEIRPVGGTSYYKQIGNGSAGLSAETNMPGGFTGLTLSPGSSYNVRLVSGTVNGAWSNSFNAPAACTVSCSSITPGSASGFSLTPGALDVAGNPSYTISDSKGGNLPLIFAQGPAGAAITIDRPTAFSNPANASLIGFTQSGASWIANIPGNNSTTSKNSYTISGSVHLGTTGPTAVCTNSLVIEVPPKITPSCTISQGAGLQPVDTDGSGNPIYLKTENTASNITLNIGKHPDNAGTVINRPTVDSLVVNITKANQSGTNWVAHIPENTNLTAAADYTINGSVTLDGVDADCDTGIVIRVPKKPVDTACPSSITSTQARLQLTTGGEWTTEITDLIQGGSVNVAGFYNNSTDFPDSSYPDLILQATGPKDSPASSTVNLNDLGDPAKKNNVFYKPRTAGEYTITAKAKDKTGTNTDKCIGTATLTVKSPPVVTQSFRIAENPSDFTETGVHGWQPYTDDPMPYDYTFSNTTPGPKFVWVEFKDSTGKLVERRSMQIKLLGQDPTVAGCVLGFDGDNTILNLTGTNFGTVKGTAKSEDTDLQVKTWKDKTVQLIWPSAPTGQTLSATLTTPDGQSADIPCSAAAQLAVGAKVFCSQPSQHQTDNVDLILAGLFQGGQKIKQKVSIDKDGVIAGLTQKLETGKNYILSLKAPKSVRKNMPFTAEDGTTNVSDFVLPVGDIFPLDGGDGKINSADYVELLREWNIAGDATGKRGDFNTDGRINSIDWACMRSSFGNSDDNEPAPGMPAATPNPNSTPSASSSASVSPSPNVTASPNPTATANPNPSPS